MDSAAIDIKNKIYTIREKEMMLDRDLAALYGVSTGNLNKAVKRNVERFPERFMFQLNETELKDWKFQFGISNSNEKRNEINMGLRKHPYVFTEQGVAMPSGVLRSKEAIQVSIMIMEAFISMQQFLIRNEQIFQRLSQVEKNQREYQLRTDNKLSKVFNAIDRKQISPEQ